MKALSALVLLLATSPLAQAEDRVPLAEMFRPLPSKAPACYGREYSTEHMEKHPTQSVRKMRVKMVKDTSTEYPTSYLEMELALTGEKNYYKTFRSFLVCDEKLGECFVECDGGSLKAWGTKSGELVLQNAGFLIDGGCGEEGEPRILEPKKNGDDLFQLYRLPAEYCQL